MTQTINQSNFSDIFNCFIDLLAEKVVEKIKASAPPERLAASQLPEKTRIDGVRGLAKYLHVSTATAQKLINAKKVKVYRAGNKLFCYEAEIDSFLLN